MYNNFNRIGKTRQVYIEILRLIYLGFLFVFKPFVQKFLNSTNSTNSTKKLIKWKPLAWNRPWKILIKKKLNYSHADHSNVNFCVTLQLLICKKIYLKQQKVMFLEGCTILYCTSTMYILEPWNGNSGGRAMNI